MTAASPAEVAAPAALHFPSAIPGFPEARDFTLMPWGGDGSPFALLRCTDDPLLEFVVVPPGVFFPEYAPEVDDATVEQLGLTTAEDALLFVILTLGANPHDTTANLMGPVVVNRHTNRAAQAVLSTSGYELRVPLVKAAA